MCRKVSYERPAYLQVVFAAIPFHVSRKELGVILNAPVTSKVLVVAVENNLVLARSFDTDTVVDK